MSETVTGSATANTQARAEVFRLDFDNQSGTYFPPPEEPGLAGMFDVTLHGDNRIRLKPRNALAASLLARWLGQKVSQTLTCKPGKAQMVHGVGVDYLSLAWQGAPLLSNGEDPFYTGQHISRAEADELRTHLEKFRARKAKEKEAALRNVVKGSARLSDLEAAGLRIALVAKANEKKSKRGKR